MYNVKMYSATDIRANLEEIKMLACDILLDAESKIIVSGSGVVMNMYSTEDVIVDLTSLSGMPVKTVIGAIQNNTPMIGLKRINVVNHNDVLTINYNIQTVSDNDFAMAYSVVTDIKRSGKSAPPRTPYCVWFAGANGYSPNASAIDPSNWFIAKQYVYKEFQNEGR